ncbi:hypothetical protein PMIN03_007575 [Paraphaeosphaeria minitans]
MLNIPHYTTVYPLSLCSLCVSVILCCDFDCPLPSHSSPAPLCQPSALPRSVSAPAGVCKNPSSPSSSSVAHCMHGGDFPRWASARASLLGYEAAARPARKPTNPGLAST